MKRKLWAALAALSVAALGAQAQQSRPTPDPADPSVAVPATVYASVLPAPAPQGDGAPTPDKAWRAANDALRKQAGHADHAGHHAPGPAPAQQAPGQAAPAAPPAHQHKHH